ncbi:MAG: hypothetical protein Q8M03_13355 [Legionella sp.]|nr:hypothetical protein [Legionella sp.]
MKRNLLMGCAALTVFFVNMAHADFVLRSSDPAVCDYISGHWSGTGKASNWFIGDCFYHGKGTIGTVDQAGHFTVHLESDKDSGSIFCPRHTKKKFTGTCVNGAVTFMTEYGNLTGDFTRNTGDVNGTLSIGRGLSATVAIQFGREG